MFIELGLSRFEEILQANHFRAHKHIKQQHHWVTLHRVVARNVPEDKQTLQRRERSPNEFGGRKLATLFLGFQLWQWRKIHWCVGLGTVLDFVFGEVELGGLGFCGGLVGFFGP